MKSLIRVNCEELRLGEAICYLIYNHRYEIFNSQGRKIEKHSFHKVRAVWERSRKERCVKLRFLKPMVQTKI